MNKLQEIMKYGLTLVACFDEESDQKIRETLKLIGDHRICKVPMKNGNRKDIDTLPFHSTLSAWKISKEEKIVKRIYESFNFQSFSSDFKIACKKTHYCLEPVQEDKLRQLQAQAYILEPVEKYCPETYHLHGTLNINPDQRLIKEQFMLFKDTILNLKIISVKLFEIYPAELVCTVDDDGFHLNKNVHFHFPQKKISPTQILIEKDDRKPFEGIIQYLKGSVKVSASTICNEDYEKYGPMNVLNSDTDLFFSSKDEKNSWFIFDFCNHRINPNCYEIMSAYSKKGSSHMKSWVLEGSNDYLEWNIIDVNKNCESLNDKNATETFITPTNSNHFYRFLRIKQIGPNWKGKDFLKFKQVEFYGIINCNENSKIIINENDENFAFEGIINCLRNSIKVSASSVRDDNYDEFGPLNAIDKNSFNFYSSDDIQNSFVIFDFGGFRVSPDCYKIRSTYKKKGSSHMRSWALEGSNDKDEWTVIDSNDDCDLLNEKYAMHTFEIDSNDRNSYQYLRIRQTGPDWKGKNFLIFQNIEFYGYIEKDDDDDDL